MNIRKLGDDKLTELIQNNKNHIVTQLSPTEGISYNTGFHTGFEEGYKAGIAAPKFIEPFDKAVKMYHLSIRHLSAMNKGVQNEHGGWEFGCKYGFNDPMLMRWAFTDKTLIYLDCGTAQDLVTAIQQLELHGERYSTFKEPDIFDIVTSITVLADETIWDREKYPDPIIPRGGLTQEEWETQYVCELEKLYGDHVAFMRPFLAKYRLAT